MYRGYATLAWQEHVTWGRIFWIGKSTLATELGWVMAGEQQGDKKIGFNTRSSQRPNPRYWILWISLQGKV